MDSHRFDSFSFITGLLFLVIGLIALAGDVALDDIRGEWIGPVLLGAAGIALLASVPLGRRQPASVDTGSAPSASANEVATSDELGAVDGADEGEDRAGEDADETR